jgi:quercetin dioxygenase-like cupin family protein
MHRKWIYAACAAAVMAGTTPALLSRAAEPVAVKPTVIATAPLTGDATREVKVLNVVLPAGADSGRHFHHGDQFTTVQEGEIEITVEGKGEDAGTHTLKAGEALHIPPMVVHRTRNLSGKPARTTEFFIVEKGKPLTEKLP